jgi:hypothetical protein
MLSQSNLHALVQGKQTAKVSTTPILVVQPALLLGELFLVLLGHEKKPLGLLSFHKQGARLFLPQLALARFEPAPSP